MLLFRLVFSPVKILLFAARIFGYSRVAVFLLGVGVGLLVAPTTGAELRRRLQDEIEARRVAPGPGPAGPLHGDIVTPEI